MYVLASCHEWINPLLNMQIMILFCGVELQVVATAEMAMAAVVVMVVEALAVGARVAVVLMAMDMALV